MPGRAPRHPQDPVGCRWIDGDPRAPGWSYCQAPLAPESSWCDDHHARCYPAGDVAPGDPRPPGERRSPNP